jgi:hypothetical protein
MRRGSIEPAPQIIRSKVGTEYIKGVGKIRDTNRMIILIAVDKILSMEELTMLTSSSNGRNSVEGENAEKRATSVTAEPVTDVEQLKEKPEGKSFKKVR